MKILLKKMAADRIKRSFNTPTLLNIKNYLIQYKSQIDVEENESGFVRIRFPQAELPFLLTDKETSSPADKKELSVASLRLNFWKYGFSPYNLGDASIHCHPYAFESYILQGGYKVATYDHDLFGTKYFNFKIAKKKSSLSYCGLQPLRLKGIETTQQDQHLWISDKNIHRVLEYHVTQESTLTLNKVSFQGKGYYHVYMPEKKDADVKLTRKKLSSQEAKDVVDDIVEILNRRLHRPSLLGFPRQHSIKKNGLPL